MWFFAVGAVILWRVWTECYTKEFMTYSGDRSSPDASHAELFGSSELSLEDLERLATTFRPSWELDEAPFAGPATFSAADVRSLQGDPQLREGLHGGANEAFSKGRISEGIVAEPRHGELASEDRASVGGAAHRADYAFDGGGFRRFAQGASVQEGLVGRDRGRNGPLGRARHLGHLVE